LKSQGKDVINLSIGEPDFNTPECIKDAAKEAIDANQTHYTPVSGMLELRKAIADKLKSDNLLEYEAQQIVVSNGAKQSIANALLCLVCINGFFRGILDTFRGIKIRFTNTEVDHIFSLAF